LFVGDAKTMARESSKEIKYNVIEHVADLCEPDNKGFIKQVNVMTWGNYKTPKIDIRKWQYKEDGSVIAGKGITLELEELIALQKVNTKNLERYFENEEE